MDTRERKDGEGMETNAQYFKRMSTEYPFTVQVDGRIEAWCGSLGEARMVAFYLRDQDRGFVAVADEVAQMLVLGWWL
jgi:hypothetical protein